MCVFAHVFGCDACGFMGQYVDSVDKVTIFFVSDIYTDTRFCLFFLYMRPEFTYLTQCCESVTSDKSTRSY